MSKTTIRLYSCYRISSKSEIVLVLNYEHHEGAWTIGGIDPNILNLSLRQRWPALRLATLLSGTYFSRFLLYRRLDGRYKGQKNVFPLPGNVVGLLSCPG
jgi:hypothetical protein